MDDQDENVVWWVHMAENVNPAVKRFFLKPSSNVRIAKFYPGLELAGKSYNVTSLTNYTNRYYTIAHCMNRYFESEYEAVTEALTTKHKPEYRWKYKYVSDAEAINDDFIEIIAKIYESKTGISQ